VYSLFLERFKYLTSIFHIEKDFIEAQDLFYSMLFYNMHKRNRVLCYYHPLVDSCFIAFNKYQRRYKMYTPYKDLTKKGLMDFLTIALKLYNMSNKDQSEFIEKITDEVISVISTHSDADSTGLMGSSIPKYPSKPSTSSEIQPLTPSVTSVDKDVI